MLMKVINVPVRQLELATQNGFESMYLFLFEFNVKAIFDSKSSSLDKLSIFVRRVLWVTKWNLTQK